MNDNGFIILDGKEVPINGERNLLELARGAGVDIPTFCYHSELSVYGACRLCLVDVQGRGIVASCSTAPEPGMQVRTNTREIRDMRKLTIELLLADHEKSCPTCTKSSWCQLQNLARRLGVDKVRFKPQRPTVPVDTSSPCLVRDPNKCVLCGDCVRVCHEIQGVGAIDFAYRGAQSMVLPSFGKDLHHVECVYCGQCARVCPTGAITPKPDIDAVWDALDDPKKTVVVQIAPAVRVAVGECFGMDAGAITTGQIVTALRAIGFDRVYDTSFAADLTVLEEGTEFLRRFEKGERLPQFTSCCPAWVKYMEQYYPNQLGHLSSCRSPQQMFGSLAKKLLPEMLDIDAKDLVVVSLMPCTAKKFEAGLEKFKEDGRPDVDYVLTTQELVRMIEETGVDFKTIEPGSLDMPFGYKSGAGVIFGNSGGVTEAVLRYAAEQVTGTRLETVDFHAVRGEEGVREAEVPVGGATLKLAIVYGLANAGRLAAQVAEGTSPYHLIEVMSCPGGCIGGAGQPVSRDWDEARRRRTKGLYDADRTLQVRKPQDNYHLAQCYEKNLGEVGGEQAHKLLHTSYQKRRRLHGESLELLNAKGADKLEVNVCVGTSCHTRGSGKLLRALLAHVQENGYQAHVDIKASFCFERCDRGPTVAIGGRVYEKCSFETARDALEQRVNEIIAMRTTVPHDTAYPTQNDFARQTAAHLKHMMQEKIRDNE